MSRGELSGWAGGLAVGAIACLVWPAATLPARGDTVESALMQAYQNNPTLNSQRASVRATDEGVPQALSGYRPRITATGTLGEQYWDTTSKTGAMPTATYLQQSGTMTPNAVAPVPGSITMG